MNCTAIACIPADAGYSRCLAATGLPTRAGSHGGAVTACMTDAASACRIKVLPKPRCRLCRWSSGTGPVRRECGVGPLPTLMLEPDRNRAYANRLDALRLPRPLTTTATTISAVVVPPCIGRGVTAAGTHTRRSTRRGRPIRCAESGFQPGPASPAPVRAADAGRSHQPAPDNPGQRSGCTITAPGELGHREP